MKFCDKCFEDNEIATIIQRSCEKSTEICPVCHNHDIHMYDTDKQNFLTPFFEELLGIYTTSDALPSSYPQGEKRSIIDDLQERWTIFSDISRSDRYTILTSICQDLYSTTPALFTDMVGLPELYDNDFLMNHALVKNKSWDMFVDEIKTKNRYHSHIINFDILERYCSFIRKTYKAGTCFYRARISEQSGFPKEKMSAPPPGRSSEGRANARGITCLYLADDTKTTLYEVRAGVFDYVSVGKFQLKKDITIVDLKLIARISPFVDNLDPLEHAINKQYLEKLNLEMSKALRRNDSTLDYVPTQYIVDFIRSIRHNDEDEYAGIEYNSTTNPGGYNLAIFDPDLFECVDVNVYDIEKLIYDYNPIR